MSAWWRGRSDRSEGRAPFASGWGGLPPHMAGRESEQDVIRGFLGALAAREACESGIVLYGPRGNGKTCLQVWARREAETRGVPTLGVSGAGPAAGEKLLRKLAVPTSWLSRFRGVSVAGTGVQMASPPPALVGEMLERRVRRGPLLLTIDEAHEMDGELGQELLNTAQLLLGDRLPLMLILAGTPDLPRRLSAMGASFWSRSRRLPIGRLRPDASADAVRIPMEEHGRAIEADALEQVVSESQGYPYFLQVWGRVLWEGCPDRSASLTLADVKRLRPVFATERGLYYDERYEELKRADLVEVAHRLAGLFLASKRTLPGDVEEAVKAWLQASDRPADGDDIQAVCDQLRDLGYIWLVVEGEVRYYEPGIPSLMAYVSRNQQLDSASVESGTQFAN